MPYIAKKNDVFNSEGKLIAVILPAHGTTMKLAREMAAYAAQQATHAERAKQFAKPKIARKQAEGA